MELTTVMPYLRSLLYAWLYRPFATADHQYVSALRKARGATEFSRLVQSLEWASSNPTYPFSELLETTDVSDKEILDYFVRLLALMKEV